jgi:nitric oxide reductase subunit B-like protein
VAYKKLWIALALVLIVSFGVLGGVGVKVLNSAPPNPSQVVTSDQRVLFDGATILDGQNAWQSIGGQEVGILRRIQQRPQRICHSAGRVERSRETSSNERVLLVDRLGCVDQSPGLRRLLHAELAARTADWK